MAIENGTISGFTHGVTVHGDGARLLNLRITSAGLDGVVLSAANDTVSASTEIFESGGTGIGVLGTGAQLLNDAVRDNGASGIEVDAAGATLTGDRVLSNGDFGSDIEAAGAKLTSNASQRKRPRRHSRQRRGCDAEQELGLLRTKLGMNAEGGVTDAGGNRGDGNGAAHQRKDVVCS